MTTQSMLNVHASGLQTIKANEGTDNHPKIKEYIHIFQNRRERNLWAITQTPDSEQRTKLYSHDARAKMIEYLYSHNPKSKIFTFYAKNYELFHIPMGAVYRAYAAVAPSNCVHANIVPIKILQSDRSQEKCKKIDTTPPKKFDERTRQRLLWDYPISTTNLANMLNITRCTVTHLIDDGDLDCMRVWSDRGYRKKYTYKIRFSFQMVADFAGVPVDVVQQSLLSGKQLPFKR